MQGYHEKFTDRETPTYNEKVAKRISENQAVFDEEAVTRNKEVANDRDYDDEEEYLDE